MKREFKTRYDPEKGRYLKKHVYGEGFVSNMFEKPVVKKLDKVINETVKHTHW